MEVLFIQLLQAIKARRSTHRFKKEEVDKETLQHIFTYGSWAPTHYMKEPWNIKLYQANGKPVLVDAILDSYQRLGMFDDADEIKRINMMQSIRSFLLAIPHHALIYFEKEKDPIRYEEDYAAVCAFIQNAQLAAWSYGIGMLWTITPYMHDPQFIRAIDLDDQKIKIAAVLQIGYPDMLGRNKGRTPIKEKLEFVE